MSELIIIAGPQAAGKSTVIADLNKQYNGIWREKSFRKKPALFVLQESRQIVAHKNIVLGAIFMLPEHECEVARIDLSRMEIIKKRDKDSTIFIDECNIFTIAHAEAHGVRDIWQYWDSYLSMLENLNAKIVFIDTPPEISWQRRYWEYERRLVYFPESEHQKITDNYRAYLEELRPKLLQLYKNLPFPKSLVDGSLPKEKVAEEVTKSLKKISTSFQ